MEKQVKIVLKSVQIQKGIGNEFTFRVGANTPFKVNFRRGKLRQLDKVVYTQKPSDPPIELSLVTLRLDVTERDPKFDDKALHRISFKPDYSKPKTGFIERRMFKAIGGDAPREIEMVYRFELLIEEVKVPEKN